MRPSIWCPQIAPPWALVPKIVPIGAHSFQGFRQDLRFLEAHRHEKTPINWGFVVCGGETGNLRRPLIPWDLQALVPMVPILFSGLGSGA